MLTRMVLQGCILSLWAIVMASQAHAQQPIASGGQTNGKARVEVLSATRTEGDTLTLRFIISNENSQDMSLTLGNLQLVDLVNRRTYGAGLTSRCQVPVASRTVCWAIFAAPPVTVKSINMQFYENFDLIPVPLPG